MPALRDVPRPEGRRDRGRLSRAPEQGRSAAGATVVCVFPGQGSQRVGMGRDLAAAFPVARRTFEEADDRLGTALARLCFEGPEDVLRLTEHAQPAILAASVAAYRVLRELTDIRPAPRGTGGRTLNYAWYVGNRFPVGSGVTLGADYENWTTEYNGFNKGNASRIP